MDNIALKKAIKKIIDGIKTHKKGKALYFDSHYVIERLISDYNNLYTSNLISRNASMRVYHSDLSKLISELGYKKIGESFSKNILGKYNFCSCWEKVK